MFEAATSAIKQIEQRLEAVERDNAFLRSCLLTNQWINRKQAALALGVSAQTVKRLQDKGRFIIRPEGNRTMYEVDSIRNYLTAQKFDNTEVDQRVLRACTSII